MLKDGKELSTPSEVLPVQSAKSGARVDHIRLLNSLEVISDTAVHSDSPQRIALLC